MFTHHSNGSTTLPRGFRYHHDEQPTTPEPMNAEEPQQPSAPRPARLKVKRRNVSSLSAPTEQFLASVAAADVPLPTIEVPRINIPEDADMTDRDTLSINTSRFLSPQPYPYTRSGSPPKTPMPELAIDQADAQRPDWYMDTASPAEDYFNRPTSALSNASDCSDDSFYSGSRLSRPSDDGSCTSPESDITDPFQFPSISKGSAREMHHETVELPTLNRNLRSKTRKDAPWTKAQSDHLWSTYLIYLQDPTVTPFRIGASSVPPEGVCHRVCRQARKSWKGPKQQLAVPAIRRSSRLCTGLNASPVYKSGSNTPTAEHPKVYGQWPHSSSSTRNHLRYLCKTNNSAVQRHRHLQSRSPTPFTKSHLSTQPRASEPPRLSSFNTKDIALSLTTSTAESMQPDGPLAKLASDDTDITPTPSSSFSPLRDFKPMHFGVSCGLENDEADRHRRLGSPFTARTYGPSTSKSNTFDSRPSPPRTQSDTISGPFLRSPLRFDRPRSLNNTQKRRAQHDLEEELSPSGAVLRPSILDEQLFGTPFAQRRVRRSRGFSLGDEALRHRVPGIFQRSPIDLPPPPKMNLPTESAGDSPLHSDFLPVSSPQPPRLGSPFSESGPSNTFPRRLLQDGSATIRRSAFATMHQTRRSIESFDFGEGGPSLQSRLGQLDMKLREIRQRESVGRMQNLE